MKEEIIRNVLKVFAVGGAAAAWSAAAGFFAYGAIKLYCTIPAESGYLAVFDFLMATLALCFAIAALYLCGAWVVRKGKFSK